MNWRTSRGSPDVGTLSSMDERPPVSPVKLLHQFNDWVEETELPGRTMAYLKTGMLHEVLAEQEGEAAATMLDSWNSWEKGSVRPEVVLEVLRTEELPKLLASLAES